MKTIREVQYYWQIKAVNNVYKKRFVLGNVITRTIFFELKNKKH